MIKAIREAGLIPVQRDTFYQPIKIWKNVATADAENAETRSVILEDNLASA